METDTDKGPGLVAEARKALKCLYLATEESIADDVNSKVVSAINDLRSQLEASEARVAELENEEWDTESHPEVQRLTEENEKLRGMLSPSLPVDEGGQEPTLEEELRALRLRVAGESSRIREARIEELEGIVAQYPQMNSGPLFYIRDQIASLKGEGNGGKGTGRDGDGEPGYEGDSGDGTEESGKAPSRRGGTTGGPCGRGVEDGDRVGSGESTVESGSEGEGVEPTGYSDASTDDLLGLVSRPDCEDAVFRELRRRLSNGERDTERLDYILAYLSNNGGFVHPFGKPWTREQIDASKKGAGEDA